MNNQKILIKLTQHVPFYHLINWENWAQQKVTALKKKKSCIWFQMQLEEKKLKFSFDLDIFTPSTSDEPLLLIINMKIWLWNEKKKCKVTDKETKVKILGLLPNSWNREKGSKEFNVPEHLAQLAKEITKE